MNAVHAVIGDAQGACAAVTDDVECGQQVLILAPAESQRQQHRAFEHVAITHRAPRVANAVQA